MFRKNKSAGNAAAPAYKPSGSKKEATPSILSRDMHILGNIITEGVLDFDGTLDGNIRCGTLTIRGNAFIKGEVSANSVFVYGRVKGLIRAKNVHLYASCNVEGIIMHETIVIEDGAFVDGKFKRTDKIRSEPEESNFEFDEDAEDGSEPRMLENIRLIS